MMTQVKFSTTHLKCDGIDVSDVTATFPDGSTMTKSFWNENELESTNQDKWKLLVVMDATPM